MKIRACFIAGILAIAVVAGVFESLTTHRKREEMEEKKEKGNVKGPEGGNCDGL